MKRGKLTNKVFQNCCFFVFVPFLCPQLFVFSTARFLLLLSRIITTHRLFRTSLFSILLNSSCSLSFSVICSSRALSSASPIRSSSYPSLNTSSSEESESELDDELLLSESDTSPKEKKRFFFWAQTAIVQLTHYRVGMSSFVLATLSLTNSTPLFYAILLRLHQFSRLPKDFMNNF